MAQYKTIYIALGSNKGDRFKHLQNAVNHIFNTIGTVKDISKVYASKAVGFNGDDFLNACISLTTNMADAIVMDKLLQIERKIGRIRTANTNTYQARVIDLDIIYIDNLCLNTAHLQVPHPLMHLRKFVLVPLNDIASNVYHPKLKQSTQQLLNNCTDDSKLTSQNIWLKNPSKQFDFSSLKYIAIEGNIGAGKTSLATKIAHDFNAKLITERFADNPFLPKFYADKQRYAFTLEMSFLADRYQQITDDISQLDLFKDFIVSDYDIFKSLIFSKITLAEDEFKLYRKLFYLMYKEVKKPNLYVYLYQNTKRLQENIKKRGRSYEQNIAEDYLQKINAGYLDFLKKQTDFNVKIIDISDKDFVENHADYLSIVNEICS